jgi:amino acid adenylation domain-containing protein
LAPSHFLDTLPSPPDFKPFPDHALAGSIGDRFAAVAADFARQLAVSDQRQSLSYAQLAEQVRQTAAHLNLQLGSGSEPVGIALIFEPTVECVVAIFAVLASGHYFCPIGAVEPAKRIQTYLTDAETRLILTTRTIDISALIGDSNLPVWSIEDLLEEPEDPVPARPVRPTDIAALLYTSGSTGRPKAVIQTHEVFLNMVKNKGDAQRISPSERIGGLASFAFGGYYWNIFAALLYGGSLHLYDLHSETFTRLEAWLLRERITHIHCTPTTLRHMLDAFEGPRTFPELRLLSTGGELLYARDVRRFHELILGKTVLGTTGATVETWFYAYSFLARSFPEDEERIPMGYVSPAAEVQLWETESGDGQEIVVFSPSLSPGYWRREDLNTAKFGKDPQGRQYFRSGDLGERTTAGLLYHRGRRDFQVKIRGMRVELGEIEQAVLDLRGIQAAVVVGAAGSNGDMRLTAYVVLKDEIQFSRTAILDHLRLRLPSHMVPHGIVLLKTLPQTRTGKVDRTALLQNDEPQNEARSLLEPRSPIESAIHSIWREVLAHNDFGVTDPFIYVGGDSISSMKVRNRIEAHFGLSLRSIDFFDADTIEALASLIKPDSVQL